MITIRLCVHVPVCVCVCVHVPVCVCGCRATYPAAAAASLLLLLLFDELHGGGRGRGRSHGSHHLDAVLWERGQAEPLPASHLHLLELLEPAQRKLERRDGHTGVGNGDALTVINEAVQTH